MNYLSVHIAIIGVIYGDVYVANILVRYGDVCMAITAVMYGGVSIAIYYSSQVWRPLYSHHTSHV